MKKVFCALFMCVLCHGMMAQDNIQENNFSISNDGFVYLNPSVTIDGIEFKASGLYSSDGLTLIKGSYHKVTKSSGGATATYHIIVVAPGTTTLASNSCNFDNGNADFSYIVRIPSSVKYIAPDAFGSHTSSVSVYDATSSAKEISVLDDNPQEVARYNLNGVMLQEAEEGVNIIKMSDNSAKKIVVK